MVMPIDCTAQIIISLRAGFLLSFNAQRNVQNAEARVIITDDIVYDNFAEYVHRFKFYPLTEYSRKMSVKLSSRPSSGFSKMSENIRGHFETFVSIFPDAVRKIVDEEKDATNAKLAEACATMMRQQQTDPAGMAHRRKRLSLHWLLQIYPTDIRCSRQRCLPLRIDPMGRPRKAWTSRSHDPFGLQCTAHTEMRGTQGLQQRIRRHRTLCSPCCHRSHHLRCQLGRLEGRYPCRCKELTGHGRRRTVLDLRRVRD